jgi:hypothetical protein
VACYPPNGQKGERFHSYNYGMNVAAILEREASYAYDENGNVTVACLTRIEKLGRGCAHGNCTGSTCGLEAMCITYFGGGEGGGARG